MSITIVILPIQFVVLRNIKYLNKKIGGESIAKAFILVDADVNKISKVSKN
jgi:hypothetical protein